jgi:hypothetical protein
VLVTGNSVLHSGTDPDERIAPLPGVDLGWDLTRQRESLGKQRLSDLVPGTIALTTTEIEPQRSSCGALNRHHR